MTVLSTSSKAGAFSRTSKVCMTMANHTYHVEGRQEKS